MSIQEGNALKYLNEKVMELLAYADKYGGQIIGGYVANVLIKLRKADFSPVAIPDLCLLFPSEKKLFGFVGRLPSELSFVEAPYRFVLKDSYSDILCRVQLLTTMPKSWALFRCSYLYYDYKRGLTTEARFNLSEVISDVELRRMVFDDLVRDVGHLHTIKVDSFLRDGYQFYRLTHDGDCEEVHWRITPQKCTVYSGGF